MRNGETMQPGWGRRAARRRRDVSRRPGNQPPLRSSRCWLPLLAVAFATVLAAGCTGGSRPAIHVSAAPLTQPGQSPGPGSDIRAENARPGGPHWQISDPGHGGQIEGYADHAGVRPGTPVRLFVSTTAASFRVRAYRIGWYGGGLARLVWTSPSVTGQRQPAPTVSSLGTVVAHWQPSLTVPTGGWPPGSYLLRLDGAPPAGRAGRAPAGQHGPQQYVPLVIDSPSVAGRVVLISPVTSYQAYNLWGGYDLYNGPDRSYSSRARVVSFDRPYRDSDGAGDFFREEQPVVSYAERLGLPLAYRTSTDLDLNPHALDGAAAAVSDGHDEYWSPAMRATLTRARDHGTNLAFFGANAIYRKIRFQSSALGPDRTEVNYKDPAEDPFNGTDNAAVTGNWPDPPDADPESSLTGQAYDCFIRGGNVPMIVTGPGSWVWSGSGVRQGGRLPGVVGPETDQLNESQPTPRGIRLLARSPVTCNGPPVSSGYGDVTYYVAGSGADVFDAGTEDWVCGLPNVGCPRGQTGLMTARTRQVIRTATRNVLQAFARGPAGRQHPAG
jgi:hypothetical protein